MDNFNTKCKEVNLKMNEANKEVAQKIQKWLQQERGWKHQIVQSDDKIFNIVVYPNPSQTVNIVIDESAPEKVTIITRLNFSEQDKKAFSSLPEKDKRDFLVNSEVLLLQINLIYKFVPDPLEKLGYVELQKQIYFDGLTRDRFFETILAILRGLQVMQMTYYSLGQRKA